LNVNTAARTIADGFSRTTVLVIGDVMVDAYLWGRVDRISPEAPVPVVQVTERSARLGGAANVVLNLHALGAKPIVVSVVGEDEHANTIERLLQADGLSTEGIVRSAERITTVKTRIISAHQHVVRVDEEMDSDITAEEELRLLARFEEIMARDRPGVIVLEDYNKGVLTKRIIQEVIKRAKALGVPVAVDPKKKNFFAYVGVDLFKPNVKELREGLKTGSDLKRPEDLRSAVIELEERLDNAITLITLSERGVYVHAANEPTIDEIIPAHERIIADVSGAGDTVIAVAALCLAQRIPLISLASWANLAGGLVCERIGVVPIDKEQLVHEAEILGL
jgi:D-glycero-beta-D-manno-heptose-7-phosphate kinase